MKKVKNSEKLLCDTCGRENEAMIKCLVEHGADINKNNEYNTILLDYTHGNKEEVKYLIEFKQKNSIMSIIKYLYSIIISKYILLLF